MRHRFDLTTPEDVFFDPVVQLAALCPICALAALRPEAALAALAPGLVLFNPALNPAAALAAFAVGLAPNRRRPRRSERFGGVSPGPHGHAGGADASGPGPWSAGTVVVRPGSGAGVVVRSGPADAVVVRPGGTRRVLGGDARA